MTVYCLGIFLNMSKVVGDLRYSSLNFRADTESICIQHAATVAALLCWIGTAPY